ncbi:phospholipid scramblase 1-like [Aplysia californica]|uniref:Phospholipid scramblase n=1 Tax=Aplysia californica TaxID=6500 RepID=A0ABM1W3A5_APLCA|nr:phospholipid scramblase 1 [Aplysia californica]XP_035829148.1 phospholipid scramblase 1-like [Aplysia californica]
MSQGMVISQPDQKGQQYQTQYGVDNQAMQMTPQSVVVQPGMAGHPGGPMMMGPPPMISMPAGLPPGLAYLAGLDEIRVHQILEIVEVLVGWERNNRYNICNNQDQKFMFAKEDTDCCTRQCCGIYRPFVMNITDNYDQPLMTLNRPWRCTPSLFWCCYLQEMEIQSPPGVMQGTIKQIWTCWTPKYKVFDTQNRCAFTIVGDCCYCKCCTDVVFRVFEGDSDGEGTEIGQIIKHWGGCREVFGGANDFSVKFPQGMDLMKKMLLFGATFLIDFNYFEYRGNNG